MLATDEKLDAEVTRAEELVEQEESVWSVTVLYMTEKWELNFTGL